MLAMSKEKDDLVPSDPALKCDAPGARDLEDILPLTLVARLSLPGFFSLPTYISRRNYSRVRHASRWRTFRGSVP
jgi:hypothetical protein